MSNSTRLRSDIYDRLCNSDRRGFLQGPAGVLGGTAVTTLLKAQSRPSGASAGMFDGFKSSKVQTTGATINVILGGQGLPVLLLHGNPQTHVMWHKIAPRLARAARDLRRSLVDRGRQRVSTLKQQTTGSASSNQLGGRLPQAAHRVGEIVRKSVAFNRARSCSNSSSVM
jgi:hypothetical protein